MKVICDTNIFISLFEGMPDTIKELTKIGNANILMPSITAMELYRGMSNKKEMTAMIKKLEHYNILHYNEFVSIKALELIETYKLSQDLEIPDAIIAATAITYQLPLHTYNKKDFIFIPGIQIYQP
jgi:predicted nucleic acid-binding protein